MNFKIDENLPVEYVDLLSAAGYSSETVVEENLTGADDAVVTGVCEKENRILLTLDLDFSDIRSYPPDALAGTARSPTLRRAELEGAQTRGNRDQVAAFLGK